MKDNVILDRSFAFSVDIVHYCRWLTKEYKEFVLSKQLVRSGTSIGANIEEAVGAVSRKEFIVKLQIAYKEARETRYWLRLIIATNQQDSDAKLLLSKTEELIRILVSILKTTKESS